MATVTRHSSYLENVFSSPSRLSKTCTNVIKKLKELGWEFDAIAVRGVSGITIGSIVASRMRKQLIVVRKDGDGSHADTRVEGIILGRDFKFVFIDDLICSGETRRKTLEKMLDYKKDRGSFHKYKYVGTILYNGGVRVGNTLMGIEEIVEDLVK
jgi:orotate phosphoribosyltransferase